MHILRNLIIEEYFLLNKKFVESSLVLGSNPDSRHFRFNKKLQKGLAKLQKVFINVIDLFTDYKYFFFFQISPISRRAGGGVVPALLPSDEPEQHGQPARPADQHQPDHDPHQPGLVLANAGRYRSVQLSF